MQGFRAASLAMQLPLIAAGCTLLVACSLLWLAATSSDHLQRQREAAYGEALAGQIAASVGAPLQRGDLLSVRASLQGFVDSSLAAAAVIDDALGLPMAQAGEVDDRADAYRSSVRVGDDLMGEVRLTLEATDRAGRQRFLLSLLALAMALSLLVFAATRWLAQRLASSLIALHSQLELPHAPPDDSPNEIRRLRHAVEHLPLDMLRAQATVPSPAREFRDASVLYVHLSSLMRYVEQLSESNLHRYTRRLQQLLAAAAQCYRGELRVCRQFGVLITFAAQRGAGSEALRAASCARLIARVVEGLQQRTSLSLDVAMALGHCELGPEQGDDMYPALYLQATIDELQESCAQAQRHPLILLADSLLNDTQLAAAAEVDFTADDDARFGELLSLAAEQETLLTHQSQLIVERIKPAGRR